MAETAAAAAPHHHHQKETKSAALQSLHTIIQHHFEKTLEKKRSIDLQKKHLWKFYNLFFIFLSLTLYTLTNSPTKLRCRHAWIPIVFLSFSHLIFYLSVAQTLRCINGFKYQRRCHKLTLGVATEKLRQLNMRVEDATDEVEIRYQEPPESYFDKVAGRGQMGACSSRPHVLDNEGHVPMAPEPALPLEVDQGTNEVRVAENAHPTPVEAAENDDSGKEEIFLETLEDEHEGTPTKWSEAVEESKALPPVVVENDVIEAAPAAEELNNVDAPLESEDSNKVETTATNEPLAEPAANNTKSLPIEEGVEAKDEAKPDNSESPASGGNGNPFQSFMANVTKGWGWH